MLVVPDCGRSYTKEDCFGSVGAGWHSLVEEIFFFIDNSPVPIYVVQCKEKFGGLRFYWNVDTLREESFSEEDYDSLSSLISTVEERSLTTCEYCGNIGITVRVQCGWIRTLCASCKEEDE